MSDEQPLGPTGQFPEGRLNADDEGEIRVQVLVANGKVVLDFGTPTVWVGLTPELAFDLGASLVRRAMALGYQPQGPGGASDAG